MPEQKVTNKERLREITEGIEQGIKDLFQSDKYTPSFVCIHCSSSLICIVIHHMSKEDNL